MHQAVLSNHQRDLLELIRHFSGDFYLAGGTAVALQAGHRRSVDFDLFNSREISTQTLVNSIISHDYSIDHVFTQTRDELTLAVNSVRVSFIYYPFAVEHEVWFRNIITMPDLLTLGALKAYALGRRAKWKDYVDLYILLSRYFHLAQLVARSRAIFKDAFNERLFREQLCFFDDVDYSENVDYLIENPPDDDTVREVLSKIALS
jgi:hypothetical protein